MERGNQLQFIKTVSQPGQSEWTINERLKAEYAEVVRFIADKRSIPALINLLDDNDQEVRWIASEAIIKIGRDSIIPLLRTIRDGRHFCFPSVVHNVLQNLLTVTERESLQELLRCLAVFPNKPKTATFEADLALKYTFGCKS